MRRHGVVQQIPLQHIECHSYTAVGILSCMLCALLCMLHLAIIEARQVAAQYAGLPANLWVRAILCNSSLLALWVTTELCNLIHHKCVFCKLKSKSGHTAVSASALEFLSSVVFIVVNDPLCPLNVPIPNALNAFGYSCLVAWNSSILHPFC